MASTKLQKEAKEMEREAANLRQLSLTGCEVCPALKGPAAASQRATTTAATSTTPPANQRGTVPL
ncbi:MAG: hypothetical protein GEU28_05995 [Dehalococcoidia bacterium]|nr:hypothetical protein [Dehalococcoidia bacterium]